MKREREGKERREKESNKVQSSAGGEERVTFSKQTLVAVSAMKDPPRRNLDPKTVRCDDCGH